MEIDEIYAKLKEKNINKYFGFTSFQKKEWTPSMIGKILDNRVYCGDLVQNKTCGISYKVQKRVKNSEEQYIIVENTHEPIIDKERFYNIQELRKSRKFNWNKRVEEIDIFDGLILCSSCESPMTRHSCHSWHHHERKL